MVRGSGVLNFSVPIFLLKLINNRAERLSEKWGQKDAYPMTLKRVLDGSHPERELE